ncbi:MAG: GGDEF domain-containing protein [Oscillospiraceae bacterium]|nr:GGDEF domain-containing protein [Oscillospiraceae bacterium]
MDLHYISERRNSRHDALTFAKLAQALADDYESIYVINTANDHYVEYSAQGEAKQLVRRSSGEDFYADSIRNCRKLVYAEDQEEFLQVFSKENVLAALENSGSFSLNYRLIVDGRPQYYFLKTIRSKEADGSIIIGVQNVDAQMRRTMAQQAVQRTCSEIAASLASLYEVIYHVDSRSGHYTQYHSTEDFIYADTLRDGVDFFDKMRARVRRIVHPEDQEGLIRALDRESLLLELRENGALSLNYRKLLDGKPQHVNLIAFLQEQDPGRVVIAIRNIDAQVRRESAINEERRTYSHIAGALASRYEAIYYIDIVSDAYTRYSASEQYASLGLTQEGADFFAAAAQDIAKYIHPEDRMRIAQQLRKDALLQALHGTGNLSLTYRQMLGGRPQYVTMHVVHPRNDSEHLVIGVLNIDAQIRREQSMAEESAAFGAIAKALAQRYEVIYRIDIHTDEYTEYTASEKYARLKVGSTGKDFFTDTQRNMKRDIYAEDYPMMASAMEKEHLLKSMQDTGATSLNYRLILDGRPQYVTLFAILPREDADHIIVAVANVDAAKRQELAFREALGSAMDMARRDALTGVKNKHAYVQTESELDAQIGEDTNPPFAVMVFDVNGLKSVNDTLGHSAGDAYIKEACALICTTFKHSPVFRIGGDEFTAILKGSDYENRAALTEALTGLNARNRQAGRVTVAFGSSEFVLGSDLRVQDVFERADKIMYEHKKQMKQQAAG